MRVGTARFRQKILNALENGSQTPKKSEFDLQEEAWADQLRGRSLVSEVNVPGDIALNELRALARKYALHNHSPTRREQVLTDYPATLLIGMTTLGALHYDAKYWPQFSDATGLEPNQTIMREWSDAFRDGLNHYGLSRFDRLPRRNIDEILMHGGVPVSGLQGLYALLADHDAKRHGELSGADFCEWIIRFEPVEVNPMGISAPTLYFLKLGREIAVDLVERLLDVLDAIGLPSKLDDAIDALPVALAIRTRQLIATGSVVPARKSGQRHRDLIPEIVYVNSEPQVLLPRHGGRSDSPEYWTLSVGEALSQATVRAPLPGDAQRMNLLAIPFPAASVEVAVSFDNRDMSWGFELVDSTTQIVAFDVDSHRLIRSQNELPMGDVWLAFRPEDRRNPEESLAVDGALQILEIADTPIGWSGWTFARCDLTAVHKVALTSAGHARWVSRIEQPKLRTEPLVPYLFAEGDQPVHQRAPRVLVPASQHGSDSGHSLVISHPSGEMIHTMIVPGSDDEQEIDPWANFSRPILGAFELQVRAGLGRGKKFRLYIAEGCDATANPTVRYFDENDQLEPAKVRVAFGGSSSEISLPAGEVSVAHLFTADESSLAVTARVDAMSTSAERTGVAIRTFFEPCRVDIEDLSQTRLSVHIPKLRWGRFELMAGAEPQLINAAPNKQGNLALSLAQVYDTARLHGSAELWCDWDDGRHLIARIRPRRLLNTVTLLDTALLVDKVYDSLDIELRVSLDLAPWRPPIKLRVPIEQHEVELPVELRGRGPITVVASEYEFWSRKVARATEENVFHLDALVNFDPLGIDDKFLLWAQTGTNCPDDYDAIAFGLKHYADIAQVRGGSRPDVLYRGFADVTREIKQGFIETAVESGWNLAMHGRLLAEGYPATAQLIRRAVVFEEAWHVSPYLGLLQSANRSEDAEFLAIIERVLGPSALSILKSGVDSESKAGTFSRDAMLLSQWPEQRVTDLRTYFLFEGGAYLDGNRRQARSLQLFAARFNPVLGRLIDESSELHSLAKRQLAKYSDSAARVISSREFKPGWQNLPADCIALAFVARLAARDDSEAQLAYAMYRDYYTDLASLAPEIVEQDLILAELWLRHWETK